MYIKFKLPKQPSTDISCKTTLNRYRGFLKIIIRKAQKTKFCHKNDVIME